MKTYLVVAHQTASSPELVIELGKIANENEGAEFVLLVPMIPVKHLVQAKEGENWQLARDAASYAKADLEAAGLCVIDALIGSESPVQAVEEEIGRGRRQYDGVIVCTFPAGISRWLRMDLPHQLERRLDIPVRHVVAEPSRAAVS